MDKIGELIKNKIKAKGESRVKVAKEIGVTEYAIRNWEQNGVNNAKLTNVKKLAKYINVDPLVLLGIEPIENEEDLLLARKINKLPDDFKNMIKNNVDTLNQGDDE